MKFKLIIQIGISIALLMPLGAQAIIINSITGGSYTVQEMTAPYTTGPHLAVVTASIINAQAVLNGDVLGDVQLGTPFAPSLRTNMTVTFSDTSQAIFSSLLITDWTDNGDALVRSYITAAANSIHQTLSPTDMTTAINDFLNVSHHGMYAWQLASDPTIATINLVNGHIIVGQDGLLDATIYLNYLYSGTSVTAPPNSQGSEVVKVTYNGSTQYLYSFSATATGYESVDGTHSYNGRYTAQTPEPATLLLLGIGFIGLAYMRNYKKT
jgi:hypothetical protein